jgi:hypothetical protein
MSNEPPHLPDLPDQGDSPDMTPNMAMAQRVMGIFNEIDEVMNDLNIPNQDRPEVMQNLMEAISADLMARLGARMSDEDKQELTDMAQNVDMENPDLQSMAVFFRDKFTPEELVQELTESIDGVLKDFVAEMS